MARRRNKRNLSLYYFLVIVIALIVFAVLSVTVLFNISEIVVSGESPYSREQIITQSGLKIGDNMIRARLSDGAHNIKRTMVYMENVRIRRVFPDKVEIIVEQCRPYANVENNGEWLLISSGGRILEILEKPQENLPKFIGYNSTINILGDYIESADEGKQEIVGEIAEALKAQELDGVREIDITDIYNISLNFEDRIRIELGTSAEIDYKIRFAKTLIKEKVGSTQEGTISFYGDGSANFREKSDIERFENEIEQRKQTETEETAVVTDENGEPAVTEESTTVTVMD